METIKQFNQTINKRGGYMMLEDTGYKRKISWAKVLIDFVEIALMTLALFTFFILGFCL